MIRHHAPGHELRVRFGTAKGTRFIVNVRDGYFFPMPREELGECAQSVTHVLIERWSEIHVFATHKPSRSALFMRLTPFGDEHLNIRWAQGFYLKGEGLFVRTRLRGQAAFDAWDRRNHPPKHVVTARS